jgi:hypothetical protein
MEDDENGLMDEETFLNDPTIQRLLAQVAQQHGGQPSMGAGPMESFGPRTMPPGMGPPGMGLPPGGLPPGGLPGGGMGGPPGGNGLAPIAGSAMDLYNRLPGPPGTMPPGGMGAPSVGAFGRPGMRAGRAAWGRPFTPDQEAMMQTVPGYGRVQGGYDPDPEGLYGGPSVNMKGLAGRQQPTPLRPKTLSFAEAMAQVEIQLPNIKNKETKAHLAGQLMDRSHQEAMLEYGRLTAEAQLAMAGRKSTAEEERTGVMRSEHERKTGQGLAKLGQGERGLGLKERIELRKLKESGYTKEDIDTDVAPAATAGADWQATSIANAKRAIALTPAMRSAIIAKLKAGGVEIPGDL